MKQEPSLLEVKMDYRTTTVSKRSEPTFRDTTVLALTVDIIITALFYFEKRRT
jgi:hypothetical protein